MDRIVEGYWDCPYCDTKGLSGIKYKKHCPNCGHPQDKGTKFYLKPVKVYLSEEEAEDYVKGPDWVCNFCNSYNNQKFHYCCNCGASKDNTKDYFGNDVVTENSFQDNSSEDEERILREREERRQKRLKDDAEWTRKHPKTRTINHKEHKNNFSSSYKSEKSYNKFVRPDFSFLSKFFNKNLFIALGIIAAIIAIVIIGVKTNHVESCTINDMSWQREISIEQKKLIDESDWSLPSGAILSYTQEEIHHYDKILDHYETKTRTESKQVQVGTETHTSYTDNGNGTFTEHTYTTPVYETQYYTVTYEEPVYKDVPVYKTKYYYKVERWFYYRSVITSEHDKDPYWGSYTLASDERVGSKDESFILYFTSNEDGKAYNIAVPYTNYRDINISDIVDIRFIWGLPIHLETK